MYSGKRAKINLMFELRNEEGLFQTLITNHLRKGQLLPRRCLLLVGPCIWNVRTATTKDVAQLPPQGSHPLRQKTWEPWDAHK